MDWEISKVGPHCEGCDRSFDEGDALFSALYDEQTEFVRRDYCPACWEKVDQGRVFSHWRTRTPTKDAPPKRFVDDDVLLSFFARLDGEEDRLKINFRFVLGLLLIRKKLLKFTRVRRQGEIEFLVLQDKREGREVEVRNPELTEEQVVTVTEECGKLLNMRL